MKREMKERKRDIAFAVVLLAIVLPNTFLAIQSVQFVYEPWISNKGAEGLRWVGDNLYNSSKPLIFVISSNEGRLSGSIEYLRNVITVFVPNNLVYIGKLDSLLLFREPQLENAKLERFAESCWIHLKTLVGSAQNLTAYTIVIIDDLYQPITSLELDARLDKVHDGVYIVKNYTAINRLIIFGNIDYSSTKGPWYGYGRNWSSYGMVFEIYANVSTDFFVEYYFYLYQSGNYTVNMVALYYHPGWVPVSVMIDNDQIMLINYSGAAIPRTYNSSEISLPEGNHTLRISPASNGWLFFNLDYIEIDKMGS
jgi:hypothetical protein